MAFRGEEVIEERRRDCRKEADWSREEGQQGLAAASKSRALAPPDLSLPPNSAVVPVAPTPME